MLRGAAARRDRPQGRALGQRGSPVTPLDYEYLRKLLRERSGLVLAPEKQYLIESRLLPVAHRAGCASITALVATRAKARRFRVWCAAASTGQEPYSLAMIVKSMQEKFSGWRIEIIATDISNNVLEKARAGIYSQFEVQRGLPIQMLMQHFQQVGEQWRLSEAIRKMVQFRQLNLLADFAALE